MLNEQDLKAIANLIAESEARTAKRFDEVAKRFDDVYGCLDGMDNRFDKVEKKFDTQIAELKEMDEFILIEACNVYKNLDERLTQMDNRLKTVQDYYRIHKLNDENTSILLSLYRNLKEHMTTMEQGSIG